MSLLGFLYLIFYNLFFSIASEQYAVPSSFTGNDLFYDNVGRTVNLRYVLVMDKIYNIFAWIDVFIDLDLIFGLLFLTLFYYGLKFASAIAKRIMGCFK